MRDQRSPVFDFSLSNHTLSESPCLNPAMRPLAHGRVLLLAPLLLAAWLRPDAARADAASGSGDGGSGAAAAAADSDDKFRCVDGTEIEAARVNDYFCDCACGSDEPRTAACSNARASKFLCREDGAQNEGRFIPSSRVNDGVCDCCDGSDEDVVAAAPPGSSGGGGGGTYAEQQQSARGCPNACASLSETDVKLIRRMASARAALVSVAREALAERGAAVDKMLAEQPVVRAKIAQLEQSLTHLEELEDAERAAHTHAQTDALLKKLGVQDMSGKEAFELFFQFLCDPDGVPPPVADTEEGGQGMKGSHGLAAFNKRKKAALPFGKSAPRAFFAHLLHARPEHSVPAHYAARSFESDLAALTKFVSEPAEEVRVTLRDLRVRLAELESSAESEQAVLDYGFEGAFYSLDGTCLSQNQGPFQYRVCPFHNVTQIEKAKVGGRESSFDLGTFSRWDPDRPNTMLFDNGKTCPGHGPRKTDLRFICGEQTAVVSVKEEKTCHYLVQATTPAACYATPSQLDAVRRKGVDVEALLQQVDEACALDTGGNPLY